MDVMWLEDCAIPREGHIEHCPRGQTGKVKVLVSLPVLFVMNNTSDLLQSVDVVPINEILAIIVPGAEETP